MGTSSAVVIMNRDGVIQVATPALEELLGWEATRITGRACPLVFDCRDRDGRPLCPACGIHEALRTEAITPPATRYVACAGGARRETVVTFWYLPPNERFFEPRVMGLISPTASHRATHGS